MKIYSFDDLEQAELTVSRMGNELEVSVYLIDGLLIDTGPYRKREELIALFEQRSIEQVILTHHHEDHTEWHTVRWYKNSCLYASAWGGAVPEEGVVCSL